MLESVSALRPWLLQGEWLARSLESVKVDLAKGYEAEAMVEADGGLVRGYDMQDRSRLKASLVGQDVCGECGCVALATIVRVRADSADLTIWIEDEALSGHSDELARLIGVPDA
jgi:hypothetical protein